MPAGKEGPGLSASDYDAIEAAVMETERGRWFLAEYARRQRAAETQILLDAIQKLEAAIAPAPAIAATPAPPPADLFAQDEELFTPVPAEPAATAPVIGTPEPNANRVVVIHRSSSEAVDIPLAAEAKSA